MWLNQGNVCQQEENMKLSEANKLQRVCKVDVILVKF